MYVTTNSSDIQTMVEYHIMTMMSSPAAQSRTDLPCASITWRKLLFSSAA